MSLTDLFDGAIARSSGRKSPLGTIIDGVSDRLSDIVIIVAITYAELFDLVSGMVILSLLVLIPYVRASFAQFHIILDYRQVEKLEVNIMLFIMLIGLTVGINVMVPVVSWIISVGLGISLISLGKEGQR